MQNKSAIWTFTILLTLACLFQISYSWVTYRVEKTAERTANYQFDSIMQTGAEFTVIGTDTFNLRDDAEKENLRQSLEESYLRSVAHEPAYPLLGTSYQDCKKRELSMGLDLKGGMAVTLEVSIPDLVYNLSGKSRNPAFRKAFESAQKKIVTNPGEDFINVLYAEYRSLSPDGKLAAIFSLANKDKFPSKMSNDEVIAQLKKEKEEAMANIEKTMDNRINKFGVSNATIQRQAGSGRIMIELPGVKDKLRVRNLLQSTANLEFWETYKNDEIYSAFITANEVLSLALYPELADKKEIKALEIDTVNTTPQERDSLLALAKSDSLTQAQNQAAQSTEDQQKRFPLFRYLQLDLYQTENGSYAWRNPGSSCIGFCPVGDTAKLSQLIHHPAIASVWPKELKLLWGAKAEKVNNKQTNLFGLYAIQSNQRNGEAPLTGSVVVEAKADFNPQTSVVEVSMRMNNEGADKWARLTKKNTGRAIAIVMDEHVYSAPMVNGEIPGGRSSITGNFSMEEAEDLANVLKSGTLPAKAQIVEEVAVGAELGESNISAGLNSFALALLVILIYMYFYYNKAGLAANIALLANVLFLVGSLASLQASLTLPGIAGIVLTIGMAVDANVLIYERIREELREGKSVKLAVNEGFKRALPSILDSNVTTLLTAVVLATFGSGPVLGFATTLIIGIFTSLFSAIFIARVIIIEWLERKQKVTFSRKATEGIFVGAKYNFMGYRKVFYGISIVLAGIGIVSLGIRGLDYGVDFTGGRTYEIRFIENEADYDAIRNNLSKVFVQDGNELTPIVKKIENKFRAKITTKFMFDDKSEDADNIVEAKLREGLEPLGKFELEASRKVDGVISNELLNSSILAVVFSMIIIFLYIVVRFRKWQFGLSALIGIIHDVLIVIGLFSLFHGILPFAMEIDQAFIAAVLTVVGYSINDTVVVFDRIREYIRGHKRAESGDLVNSALNSTLGRTLNTAATVIMVLSVMFIFGGDSMRGFIFALLVGIVVGTYSSLFVSSPLVYDLSKKLLGDTPAKGKS